MIKKHILTLLSLPLFILLGFNYNVTGESLHWEKPAIGIADGYIIHYGKASDNLNNKIDVGNITKKNLDQLILQEKTTYFFAISAYNKECKSELSNIVSWVVPDTTPPMPPSNLMAY
jgi:hypothetical protein